MSFAHSRRRYNWDMASVGTTFWGDIPELPLGPDHRVRFSRQAYHRMFETGVLSNEKRYELIDGEVVMMSPLGPSNSALISRLTEFFVKHLPDQFECRIQLPLVVSDHSEPEPDLAIVRRSASNYREMHPTPEDVLLLVEVASSSLSFDLGAKQRLYAASQIQEYWVVDVDDQSLIVHRQADAGSYADTKRLGADASDSPLAVPECQLDLGWLFG
jgi:Uma2 family endonuclease